ncbi:MAG: response regulator transcription factor [Thermodesulfobacteriota bacterium]
MEQTILLVDDEDSFRNRLAKAFVKRGFTVYTAANYDEGLAVIREKNPAMAVIDLKMPGKSGLELVAAAREASRQIRMVVLTGYGSIATAAEAVRLGALYYLPKPADVDDILNAFSRDQSLGVAPDAETFEAPSLARVEWEHINRVLHDCCGNISAAAQKLGIHRRSLQRKLQKYPPAK